MRLRHFHHFQGLGRVYFSSNLIVLKATRERSHQVEESEAMPKTKKAAKAAAPKKAEKVKAVKAAKVPAAKKQKPKAAKAPANKAATKAKPRAKKTAPAEVITAPAELLSSEVVFAGPLFRVTRDRLIEPGGREGIRDVVRHNGSVVILALDKSKSKRNPYIVMERQYRHAAGQYLWELPAGKLEPGEVALSGAQRELEEETGYRAKKWKLLIEYYASPGFLGESMKVFVAEGLVAGEAHPEEDEKIELRLVKLSELLKQIEKGAILDGKTLSSVQLYARLHGR